MILMVQESESQSIKEEVIVLAQQLTDMIDGKVVNQEKRGVITRLSNQKAERFSSKWKSVGLFMLILGITYSIL